MMNMEKENQTESKRTRSFLLPHYVIYFKELDTNQRLVLIALLEREDNFKGQAHSNTKGKPFYTTQEWLSSQLSLSLSTIKRSMKKLQEENYISRSQGKAGAVTTYVINWAKIDGLNNHFTFDNREPQQTSNISSTEINETGPKSAAQIDSVRETPKEALEKIPTSRKDIPREWIDAASKVLEKSPHMSVRDPECQLAIAKATNSSLQYVEQAINLITPT